MSWVANLIGLATIVGAFAAGLILNEQHFEKHPSKTTLEELMAPLERIFAPVFFVLMGMQVNLSTFAEPGTLGLVAAFTVVAIIGKILCGLPAGNGLDRLTVGVGMVPRGEVGLIFASIGKGLGVLDDSVFSALVVVVMASTLVTPPALKWSLGRRSSR
jgi:Kef-type K+ transport system membrane component KefB